MNNPEPVHDNDSDMQTVAAKLEEELRRIRAAEATLARVRYLSENACRPKRPLPKPTPVVEPTKLDPPYENAA